MIKFESIFERTNTLQYKTTRLGPEAEDKAKGSLLSHLHLPQMALDSMPESSQSPLLGDTVNGSVDHKGLPAKRSNSGGWRSLFFIIGKHPKSDYTYIYIDIFDIEEMKKRVLYV